jgi:hypothetical protein
MEKLKAKTATWQTIIDGHNGHWFDAHTIKFWKCRISWDSLTPVLDGWLFISSEMNFDGSQRLYTLRKISSDFQEIETVSEFQEFQSLGLAKRQLEKVSFELGSC